MIGVLSLPKNVPEFCYRFIRGFLYALTFILCILGLSMVFFAFWYIYEGKTYHLDSTITFSIFSISFILGAILFAISSCGLTALLRENMFLARAFMIGMLLLIAIQFGSILLVYMNKSQILSHANDLFKDFIKDYAEDDDMRLMVDTIQSELKCCGISSPDDWDLNPYYSCDSISSLACSVPASCCYSFSLNDRANFNLFCGMNIRSNGSTNELYQMAYIKGCKYAIYTFLEYKYKVTATIFIGVLVPQMFGLLLIIVYILLLKYMDEIRRVDSHLIDFSSYLKQVNDHGTNMAKLSTSIYQSSSTSSSYREP